MWLRGWDALASAHGLVGCAALGVVGWHARFAALSVLFAAAAIGTGFVLLP